MSKQCINCGSSLPDHATHCSTCDTPQYSQNPTVPGADPMPTLGMKWYKFLIYFALFFTAFVNVVGVVENIHSIRQLLPFQGAVGYVDDLIRSTTILISLYSAACLGFALWALIVRRKLARFCADGPKQLILMRLFGAVTTIVYIVAAIVIMNNAQEAARMQVFNISGLIEEAVSTVITTIVWILVNKSYFEKRSHLFFN